MKVSYHLGNRHVPLMLTPTALYFEPDHVLSDMLQRLGAQTKTVQALFESETGAYQQHSGHSHHNHSNSHNHSLNHTHLHDYSHHSSHDYSLSDNHSHHSYVHCDK